MVVSAVQIANMALSHLGARNTIESFNEASTEAKQCKLWYDSARQQALEALNWSFARKRQVLALHSEAADLIKWQFRYILPSDSLKIRELENPAGPTADAVPFTIEVNPADGTQKTLLTNLDQATAIYTFDQTLTNVFSSLFVEALAFLLAEKMAYTLTGKGQLKKEMMQAYLLMLRWAEATDSNEQVDNTPREAEWIRGR